MKVLVVTKIITTYDGLTKMQEYGGVTTAQVTDGTATRTYHNYSGYFVLGGNIIVGAEEDALEVGSRESLSSQGSINANYGFSGVFDGRGYTISGLKVYHSGLFGDLAAGSVIKNVAFNNVTVTGNTDNSGAGVIGYTSCGATIENVFISMSTSSARSGAIAGRYMRGGTLKNVVICYEKTGGYNSGAVSCWTAGALTVENVYVIYTTTTPEADRKLAGEQTFLSNGTVTEYDEEDLATAEFSGLPEGWYVAEGGYPMFESSIGGMYISQTTLTGTVGGQGSLQGYVYGASQSDNIGLPVVWKSDDTQVVQVSQTGAYEFVGEGSATITVTYGKFKATCTVEVDAAAVQIVDRTGTTLDVEANSTTGLGTQIVNAGVEAELFDTFTPTAVYFESAPDTDYNDDYGTETGFFATYDTGNETARTLTLIVANGDTALYRVKVLVITKIITSYAELAALQSYTEVTEGENAGGATYYSYGGYFVLANNLVATGEEAAFAAQSMGSISSGGHTTNLAGFHGTFDGRGYTVSGFKYALGGIFGDVGNDAVIKNVAFVNCIANDIDYAATETRVDGIGILAVNACGSFLVDNVLVSASVNSPNGGALFGRSTHSGTISNTVIRVNQTTGWNIGAISGWNVYTIGTFLENVYVIFEGSSNRIFGNQELDATTYKEGSTVTTMTVEEISTTSFTGLSDTYWTVTEGEMPTFNSMADIESA